MGMTAVFEKQMKTLEKKKVIEDAKSMLSELYIKNLTEEQFTEFEGIIKVERYIPEDLFEEIKEQVKSEMAK